MKREQRSPPEMDRAKYFDTIPGEWASSAIRELVKFRSSAAFKEQENRTKYQAIHDVGWYCILKGQVPIESEILEPTAHLPNNLPDFQKANLPLSNHIATRHIEDSYPEYGRDFSNQEFRSAMLLIGESGENRQALQELVVHVLKCLAREILQGSTKLVASLQNIDKTGFRDLFESFHSDPKVDSYFMTIFLPWIQLKLYANSVLGLICEMFGPETGFGTAQVFGIWLAISIKSIDGLEEVATMLYRRLLFNGWLDSSTQFLSEMKEGAQQLLDLFPPSFRAENAGFTARKFFLRVKQIKWLALDCLQEVDGGFARTLVGSGVAYLLALPHISLIQVQNWFNTLVIPWLYNLEGKPVESEQFKTELFSSMMQCYCRQKQQELFQQLISLPQSMDYFNDMRLCILAQDVKPRLRTPQLLAEMHEKLLVPTTPTSALVDFFFKAIIGASHLDSSGVFLEWLLAPLRTGLAARPDALHWVVEALLENDFSKPCLGILSLDQYLHRAGFRPSLALRIPIVVPCLDFKRRKIDMDEDELEWVPPPIEAGSTLAKARTTCNTTASLLTSLLPDRKAALEELHAAIARHLIRSPSHESLAWLDAKVEAFASFFDEQHLRALRIMRSDLARSHENARRFRELLKEKPEFQVIDASKVGWPRSPPFTMHLPPSLQDHLTTYAREFKQLKPNLRLVWDHQRTSVEINISLPSGPSSMRVSLPQSAVISVFVDQSLWDTAALCSHFKLSSSQLNPLLHFWVEKGALVRLRPDTYSSWDKVPVEDDSLYSDHLVAEETESEELSDPDDEDKVSLPDEIFLDLQKKCIDLLKMIMNRTPTVPVKPEFLHHSINKFRSPPNSFMRDVPIALFCKYLEKLVEKEILAHAPDDASMYLLPSKST